MESFRQKLRDRISRLTGRPVSHPADTNRNLPRAGDVPGAPPTGSQDDSASFTVLFNDQPANNAQNFPSNFIKTSKYSLLTFLPLNLYEQFKRFANIYFLACIIIQIIPNVSPFPIYTTVIPLVVILAVSAIKEAVEDYNRHRQDYIANNRNFGLVRNYKAKSRSAAALATLRRTPSTRTANANESSDADNAIMFSPGGSRMRKGHRHATSESPLEIEMADVADGESLPSDTDAGADAANDDWLTPISSKDILVGHFLKIRRGEEFPADILLLSSSNSDATAYVNTANLDGEAVPKVRNAPQATLHANTPQKLLQLHGRVRAEGANASLYQFQARIEMDQNDRETLSPQPTSSEVHIDEKGEEVIVPTPRRERAANVDKSSGRLLFPVGDQQLCLRGSRLVNTEWIFGVVIYTGYQTKMMLNRNAPRIKDSSFEHQLNKFVAAIFVFNFFVCLVLSISYSARNQDWAAYYSVGDRSGVGWLLNFLTQYILFSFMIPISLYVTIELVRVGQVFFMMWDKRMHYKDEHGEWKRMQVKSSSLNEELGCIEYIFSDKTGTLTCNKMELSAMSVNGNLYFERSAADIAIEEAELDSPHGGTGKGDKGKKMAAETKEDEEEQAEGGKVHSHEMVADLVRKAMNRSTSSTTNGKHYDEEKKQPDSNTTSSDANSESIEREFLWCIMTCNSVLPSKKKPEKKKADATKGKKSGKANPESQSVTSGMDSTSNMDTLESVTDSETSSAASSQAASREKWQFQSMSPDEMALCETCHRHGLTMTERRGNTVTVNYLPPSKDTTTFRSATTSADREEYVFTVMASLDFTSTRARMSVVMKMPDGTYRLFTKGADSAVYKRLDTDSSDEESIQKKTAKHVETFAGSGSRTLCYAYRVLSASEFASWEKTYQQAVNALEDREALVELAFEEIEHSMVLLGCTGVEDQLQEWVPETIDYMIKAGLKVIVLTGDKKETAVTISKQSNLVQEHFELLYMQGTSKDAAKQSLDAAINDWQRIEREEMERGQPQPFALAIDGLCMELCLKNYRDEFISLFTHCQTIVSYRSTPRQKALCVGMAKIDLRASVLAIGDGANDVSAK